MKAKRLLLVIVALLPSLLISELRASPQEMEQELAKLGADLDRAVTSDRAIDAIYGKVMFRAGDTPTFEILANETFATDEERVGIKRWGELLDVYYRKRVEVLRRHSYPFVYILEAESNVQVQLIVDLYQRRLTYSDFAKRRTKVRQDAMAQDNQAREQQRAGYAASQAERDRQMTDIGAALLMRGMPQNNAPATGTGGAAFLRRHYVSGMNRVCIYSRMGSDYVVTIGSTQICPLTQ